MKLIDDIGIAVIGCAGPGMNVDSLGQVSRRNGQTHQASQGGANRQQGAH